MEAIGRGHFESNGAGQLKCAQRLVVRAQRRELALPHSKAPSAREFQNRDSSGGGTNEILAQIA